MDDISKKNEIVQAMTAVEYHLVLPEQTPNLSGYTKLPFGMFASLGVGLAFLPECFRTVATTAATSGKGLWRLSTILKRSSYLMRMVKKELFRSSKV